MQTGRESRDQSDSICDSGVVLSDASTGLQSFLSQSSDAVGHLPSPHTFTDSQHAPATGDEVTTAASCLSRQLLQLLTADNDGDT